MTMAWRLVLSSLRHYWPTHLMVVAGVAVAVSVLAGALVVGASVRESLRGLVVERLGATDYAVSSTALIREALADALADDQGFAGRFAGVTPLIVMDGAVTHEASRRTASKVVVYGVDERFARFHGVDGLAPDLRDVFLSPALARELEAADDDSLLLRVARPTDIPLTTLQGRRDDAGARIRLRTARVLDRASLGEFSLAPAQGAVRAVFAPLARLQQDLGLRGRVNALLVSERERGSDPPQEGIEALTATLVARATLADLGLSLRAAPGGRALVVESATGLLPDQVVRDVRRVADEAGSQVLPVLTYLANTIATERGSVPYSTIAAMDLAQYARMSGPQGWQPDEADATVAGPYLWLNAWAAEELQATPDEPIAIEYFLWSDEAGLETRTASFLYAGAVPMAGAGGDHALTPEYPGITDAENVMSWDPPFPVDLSRVRDRDEDYWDEWRAAPKAFIALPSGQMLWPSTFGSLSSLRVSVPPGATLDEFHATLAERLRTAVDPGAAGLQVRAVRADGLASAEGTTDFGEYFVYFSFFLVVSGLLLAYLFFALGLEQRAREVGLLTAVGFTGPNLRAHFLREGAVLAAAGLALGVAGAVGYAALIVYGLRTWWVDAVGTTALELHVAPSWIALGAGLTLLAGVLALHVALGGMARRSTRALLSGALGSGLGLAGPSPAALGRRRRLAFALVATAAAALGLGAAGVISDTAGFFAAGGALLVAGLAGASARLWSPARSSLAPGLSAILVRFGLRHARWRPTRSVLSLALIAFATFVLVSVGAFRRDASGISLAPDSGTGGYVLMAESVTPLVHDPNTASGRAELSLPDEGLAGARVARFRLRPGDEASCLTLYRPRQPRIIAPAADAVSEPRFRFAASLADTPEERENPWRLLDRRFPDGAVPVIVDATSLTYVFHLSLGDDFTMPVPGGDDLTLRVVATLADSVFQSEVVMGEAQFTRLFPRQEGYRVWLVEAPEDRASEISTLLEDRLSDFGVDVIETRARLAAYHRVENTYLSTFQALGALGLLVGTLGLGAVLARNVLERRRELGLLRAIGYEPGHVRRIVLAESAGLLAGGLALGTGAALVAVAPALVERGGVVPIGTVLSVGVVVIAAGLLATLLAARMATHMGVVAAIKSE
jgi:putative ABC transport system permease protein